MPDDYQNTPTSPTPPAQAYQKGLAPGSIVGGPVMGSISDDAVFAQLPDNRIASFPMKSIGAANQAYPGLKQLPKPNKGELLVQLPDGRAATVPMTSYAALQSAFPGSTIKAQGSLPIDYAAQQRVSAAQNSKNLGPSGDLIGGKPGAYEASASPGGGAMDAVDTAIGAGKSLLGNIIYKNPGDDTDPNNKVDTFLENATTPSNTSQEVGAGLEKVGEMGLGAVALPELIESAGEALGGAKNLVNKFRTQPLAVEEALAPTKAGAQMQGELRAAKQAAGEQVGAAREAVYPSPDTTIKIGGDSPLAKQVETFLGQMPEEDTGLESLRSPETTKAREALTELKSKLDEGMELTQKQVKGLKDQFQIEATRLNTLNKTQGIGGTESGIFKKLGSALNESETGALSEISGPEKAQAYSEAKQGYAEIAGRQARGLAKKAVNTEEPSKIIDSFAKGSVSPETVKATLQDIGAENLPKYRQSVLEQALKNSDGDWEGLKATIEKKPETWKALLGDEYEKYVNLIEHNSGVARRLAFLKSAGVKTGLSAAGTILGFGLANKLGWLGHAAKALAGE